VSDGELRQMVEMMPCGVVVASTAADGRITLVNAAFTAITGYTHDDVPTVVAWLARAYPDPDYRARVMSNWERDVSEPERDVFYRVCCADGSTKELLLRAGLQGPDRMIVTLLDLSHMKQVERQLRDSEERFRLIAETVDQVFWIHGIRPEVMEYVSPAFEGIWGFPVARLYEDPHQWSVPMLEEDRAQVDATWSRALAGDLSTVDFEYRIRRADGEVRWIEDRGFAIRNDAGEVVRLVGIAKDVTARRNAEASARAAEQRVQTAHKMEAIGRLAGGVAHDFNNVLCAITGNTSLALFGLAETDPRKAQLENILTASERAADLTRQLMAFSRQQATEPRVIDPSRLVADMHVMLLRLIGEDVILRTGSGALRGRILADPGQIERIVLNLTVNARDAMPGGGELRIEAADVALATGDCAGSADAKPGAYVMLSVSDTGAGIEPAIQEQIFEPFYTTKQDGLGTGLGLSIVYGIVEQAGGWIEVISAPNEGTSFHVYLPCVAGEEEPGTVARRAQPTGGQETVLLVEDEDIVREPVVEYLRHMGYRVLVAASGREALEIAWTHGEGIDLLLTDVVMPHMNGRELATRIVAQYPGIRVMYASGYAPDVIGHLGVLDEGADFVAKPYALDTLASRIRELFDRA
jgi:two-component system, cell cycle sensor histidine kinase and response regulator CckA